jgi:hypothetical protein
MDVHNIVLLSQRDNLSCSLEKERQIEMKMAYHLDVLRRGFQSKVFDENLMENLDETYFIMVIRISGGHRSMVEASILIFTNGNSNCPIRGLEDTIPGVCYRTGLEVKHYFLNILRNQELINLISITVQKPFGWTIVRDTTLHLN